MTWPTVAVDTTDTDADGDSPLAARQDLLDALQKLNQMIAHVTTFMATVLDDADAAAARTTLGVAIGTNVQAFDATLSALAALTIAADSLSIGTGADAFTQTAFAANKFPARSSSGSLVAKDITDFGLSLIASASAAAANNQLPLAQNSQSANYTTVLADAQKHLLHPTADNNPRTFTIDSNANVAYVLGTTITFVNQINTLTIAITADTMTLAGAGTTGSRTLAASGIATALKVSTTGWIISGTGLT